MAKCAHRFTTREGLLFIWPQGTY
eukprot:COSAG01_NODE_2241_length_8086_cov_25.173282_8_plen_23_part_01